MASFGRTRSEVTAVGGYMFGKSRATERACYYNEHNYSIYSQEGHAEVVKIDVPKVNSLLYLRHILTRL